MKAAVDQARAAGLRSLSSGPAAQAFVSRYRALLAAGHAANPPPARRPRQRGRVKQTPARNLLERLWLGQDEVLAFLDDFDDPLRQQPGRARRADAQSAAESLRLLPLDRRGRRRIRAASVAIFPPSGSKAWRCSPPSKPLSPVSHSTQTSPE